MFRKTIILLVLSDLIFSQISLGDLNKISNAQLDAIREELKNQPAQSSENNLSNSLNSPKKVNVKSTMTSNPSENFGYSYFNKSINFFDNIPTPKNFILGPGDEIILSLWGETNSRESLRLNKDGSIYYKNLGFINLSNITLEEAEGILEKKLSQIYSSIKEDSNGTQLRIELGSIKSMNVYFTGQVNSPGVSLIHPFSDIFTSLIQSGGIKENGSLRNIELIRNKKVIKVFDFYDFFISGKNIFSDTRILEGDIIHVPLISKRVEISGSVYEQGSFELLKNESLLDLIDFTGGFKVDVSQTAIIDQLIPLMKRDSDDVSRSSKKINIRDFENIIPNNGDTITIIPAFDNDNKVSIIGQIKSPGVYPISSLKEVLDIAGGFNDPIFRKSIADDRITILRRDSQQFYSQEFEVTYEQSTDFELQAGDNIFVYENSNYDNVMNVQVVGAVKYRGNYPYKKGLTVGDFIELAGGFNELANPKAIIVNEKFSISGGSSVVSSVVNNADIDFQVSPGSKINILPLENVVNVTGNVYEPGLIVYESRKSLRYYLQLAGGAKKHTLKRKIYVKRANGEIDRAGKLFDNRFIFIEPGDTIIVPKNPEPKDFDLNTFLVDIVSILSNLVLIYTIADSNNN